MSVPDLIAQRYRLVAQVGAGGMGLVYKAIDTRLDRAVAIKAINRAKLERHGTVDRLREEALTAASLDHPFICRIYELIDEGAETYIVMEFVEGETLATMMHRGHLPLTETVRLFSEIAEGLANAHGRGLVHRDIKPSNVMVTPHGHVKLLDFGIAQPDMSSQPEADTKTSADAQAARGGTPQYMSPEQATGAPVTARADLFSLGVALYECLARRLPFEGTTDYDYVHHLIASTPKPLHKLAPDAPDDLVQLVEQCLERTPAHRPDSAAFVASELRRIGGHLTSPTGVLESARGVRKRRRRALIAGAGLIAIAGIAFAVWQWMQPHWGPIGRNRPVTTSPGREIDSRISPDGKWILFTAARGSTRQLFVQQIDGQQPRPVTLPTGLVEGCLWSPPDQNQIACLIWQGEQLTLQIVPALFGGASVKSIPLPNLANGARLSRWIDSTIYLVTPSQGRGDKAVPASVQRLDVASEKRSDVPGVWASMERVQDLDVRPDGREVVLLVFAPPEARELWIAGTDGSPARRLTPADDHSLNGFPKWSADGKSVIYESNRGGYADLWQIDRRTGQQRQLTSSPAIERPDSVSADGSVSFQLIDESAGLWSWSADGANAGRPLTEEALSTFAPTFSRDGRVVAFQRSLPSPREGFVVFESTLVVREVDGLRLRDDTRDEGNGFLPRLSPDGSRLAFYQSITTTRARLHVRTRTTGETVTLTETAAPATFVPSFPVTWSDQPIVWSASGDVLYFIDRADAKNDAAYRLRRDVVAKGLDGLSILQTKKDRISDLQVSPDGKQLAYLVSLAQTAAQLAAGTRAFEVHVLDVAAQKPALNDVRWALLPEGRNASIRGWTADGGSVLITRMLPENEDLTHGVELFLVSPNQTRPIGTIDHAVPDTLRMSPTKAVVYVTRSENGIGNVYEWSLATRSLKPISDNSLIDVTFASVERFGDDRLAGVRDVRKHDIWLLDTRSTQSRNPAPASR